MDDSVQDLINGLAGHVSLLDSLMKLAAKDLIYLVVPLILLACLVATSRPLGEVARDLRMLIPAAEWPARWARVPRIHYLDSDKLDLRWASEALDSREDRDVGAPSATFTVPSFLVGAWRRFAPLFSEDADFFASGGDSLTAMELLEAIYNETGIDIDLADFLTEPTLLKLADVIQSSPS